MRMGVRAGCFFVSFQADLLPFFFPLLSSLTAQQHDMKGRSVFASVLMMGGECMGVRARLSVSLEIAQRDKAGLREAEMLMWTKVCSLCNVYESLYFMQGLSSLR